MTFLRKMKGCGRLTGRRRVELGANSIVSDYPQKRKLIRKGSYKTHSSRGSEIKTYGKEK